MSLQWLEKTWSGLTNFVGKWVWTDGDNIYYSFNGDNYVLDKSTSTWSTKTWNGTSAFDSSLIGGAVWTDGNDIYYSNGPDQFVLNKSTSTWTTKTWDGIYQPYASSIWTDGENIYYSSGSTNFVYDKSTTKWSSKSWNGYHQIDGPNIWTDGDNIYFSSGTNQYVLDKATSTWNPKTWNGLTSYYGVYVWTDGTDVYYSDNSNQYVLDKATSTWNPKTWDGLTSFRGDDIWSDGTDTYYSNAANQYGLVDVPDPSADYLSKITLPVKVEGVTTSVEFTLKDAEARGMIEDLGHALYWMGVTTTVMSDGLTTADVVIDGETVTPDIGGLVSYSGSEFVWNGTAWQEMGKNNFGALAFKSSAVASYTPAGTVSITKGEDVKTSFTPFGSAGTRASASWEITGETATFSFNAGTLPSAGTALDLVTGSSTDTATFSGTQATITAE